jgi:site-specific recombinase XerD
MKAELVKVECAAPGALMLPSIIVREGRKTQKRFLEFFAANIRNLNTRTAYIRAVVQFLDWCEGRGISFQAIEPLHVAAYVEQLTKERAPMTVKQHLAAMRMMFDWMVTGGTLSGNPALSVRGPRYQIKKGKTPILCVEEMRRFLDKMDVSTVVGLRDRALIALMVYSFGRVSAVVKMRVKDYFPKGKRHFIKLHEKGGKYHEVPVHHKAEDFLDAYMEAAGIVGAKNTPLFRSAGGKGRGLTKNEMSRFDVWAMVKRRAKEAGIQEEISPHSFRATGITAYLENGGTLEKAQQIAAHESASTTKLYDRTSDAISLDEIERILI